MLLSVGRVLTNPRIVSTANRNQPNSSYSELLIGRVTLTSFTWRWRTYWVVGIGAYSLNNLRLW